MRSIPSFHTSHKSIRKKKMQSRKLMLQFHLFIFFCCHTPSLISVLCSHVWQQTSQHKKKSENILLKLMMEWEMCIILMDLCQHIIKINCFGLKFLSLSAFFVCVAVAVAGFGYNIYPFIWRLNLYRETS